MTNTLHWFRQDLRCQDNPALSVACQSSSLIPLYIDDSAPPLPMGAAQRWWLHHSLHALQQNLYAHGLNLCLRRGDPLTVLQSIIKEHRIDRVFWNRCYEPQHIARDTRIKAALQSEGVEVVSCNGSLLNEPWTITNQSGAYYKVFTPFWRHCLRQMPALALPEITSWPKGQNCVGDSLDAWSLRPTRPDWAAEFSRHWQPGECAALDKLERFTNEKLHGYAEARDQPMQDATSKLSPHLHFGEISPWRIWHTIEDAKRDPGCDLRSADRFLAELGWREFSTSLLYHYPQLPDTHFKRAFDNFAWQRNDAALRRWQRGLTGYPIVDAGMRELWRSGYMHNRVRMIAASFLIKHLLIDWREGASWFWDTLLDADLANNSASWQWVAGSGADAAPYFRIFNPIVQGETFDPQGDYVKRWVPELANVPARWIHKPWEAPLSVRPSEQDYPPPIVEHAAARQEALARYQRL